MGEFRLVLGVRCAVWFMVRLGEPVEGGELGLGVAGMCRVGVIEVPEVTVGVGALVDGLVSVVREPLWELGNNCS